MATYFLKNESGSAVTVDDLGIYLPDSKSLIIDSNDINGYLSSDLNSLLTAGTLVLSTTDVGNATGDLSASDAISALNITSRYDRDNPHSVDISQVISVSKSTDAARGLPEVTESDLTTTNLEHLFDSSDVDQLGSGSTPLHTHDNRYYTKTQLSTSGQSTVDWDNIANAPQFGSLEWKEPVSFNLQGSGTTSEMNSSSPSEGWSWWNTDDDHIYKYVSSSWVDQGAPSDGDRVIFKDGSGSDDKIYEYSSSSWGSGTMPSDNWAVMVNDDGDGKPAQYVYDDASSDWIKIADVDWGTHNSLGGRSDTNAHPATAISYDNSTSGLTSVEVQGAIDELDVRLDSAEYKFHDIIYVDKSRTDSYTETGSISYPYKTISSALAVASDRAIVRISGDTYNEDFTVPNGVSIEGAGEGHTIIYDNGGSGMTIGTGSTASNIVISGCSLRTPVTINVGSSIVDFDKSRVFNEGYVTLTTGDVRNLSIQTTESNTPALTMSSTATQFVGNNNIISSVSDGAAIVQNGGLLRLSDCLVSGSNSTGAIIDSNSGTFNISNSTINNTGTGTAIDGDNGASSSNPNQLRSINHSGDIALGSSSTYVEDVNDGDPTGTAIILTPSTQSGYDNSTSGLTATNVQDAIDELTTEFGVELDNILFVAKNGVDVNTEVDLGTVSNPYLTIQAAVNRIISNADNTINNGYAIVIMPGVYAESVVLEDSELVNIAIYGSGKDVTIIQPGSGDSIQSISNNDGFLRFHLKDIQLDMPVVLTGASDGTDFGDYFEFENCLFTPNADISFTNINYVDITGSSEINGDLTYQNVAKGSIIGGDGIKSGSIFTVSSNGTGNLPTNFTGDTIVNLSNTIIVPDIAWSLTNSGKATIILDRATRLGTSGCTIPSDGTLKVYNSTLIGDYVNNGTIELYGYSSSSGAITGTAPVLKQHSKLSGYDNSVSGLSAVNVQDAIDELDYAVGQFKVPKGNSFPTSPAPEDADLFYRTDLNLTFQYDGSRSKWLSVTQMFLDWGSNVADGKYLRIHGSNSTQSGYLMPRNGTIISITAKAASGNLTKTLEIRRNHNAASPLATFNLSGGSYSTVTSNIDFNSTDYIQAFASSSGVPTRDLVVMITIAWRE